MRMILPLLAALCVATPAFAHEGELNALVAAPVSALEQAETDYQTFRVAGEAAADYLLALHSFGGFSLDDVHEARAANNAAYQALLDVRAAQTEEVRNEALRRLYISNMRLRNFAILARSIYEQR